MFRRQLLGDGTVIPTEIVLLVQGGSCSDFDASLARALVIFGFPHLAILLILSFFHNRCKLHFSRLDYMNRLR